MSITTDQLLRITTWNVAGKEPFNGPMLDYLFDDSQRIGLRDLRPEIQVVGLQEAPQYLFSDPWTSNLSSSLRRRGYILFKRHKLSGILLYIFVLREIMLQARDFETESVKTGFGGLLGNKGGVSLRFSFNGNSFSVTNSHLAAHQEHLQQRVEDYNSILSGTKFKIDQNTSSIKSHDYSFWFGDLNFRFDDIEKYQVLDIITKARTETNETEKVKTVSKLYENDQLNRVKKKGLVFDGFEENLPTFLPTYKFQIGSVDNYDSEQRIPAWTDRVLFRANTDAYKESNAQFSPKIQQIIYTCLPETNLSDHKPVISMFKVSTFNPKKHNPSALPYEVIKFEPIVGWKSDEDGRLWYKISNELFYRRPKVLSSWDKLALYKDDFSSIEDYLTIVFANNVARVAPNLEAQQLAYQSSAPSSKASSPANSRRGSTSSMVSVGTEAITLNDPPSNVTNSSMVQPTGNTYSDSLPPDAVIGDGFKYFTATFSDDVLIPGKYVILYLKTNPANEYNVYGISDPFTIS